MLLKEKEDGMKETINMKTDREERMIKGEKWSKDGCEWKKMERKKSEVWTKKNPHFNFIFLQIFVW